MYVEKYLNFFALCLVKFCCDKMPHSGSGNGGLSSAGAVWHILEIQALALSHGGAAPCHEPFLIGNVPSACFLAPLLVLLPHAACT